MDKIAALLQGGFIGLIVVVALAGALLTCSAIVNIL